MNDINIKDIDFNLIKAFAAMMQTRNVSNAAKTLGIGQPAMSHALSRMRETFDDALFIRTPSGMRPTQRAREIAKPIERVMAEIHRVLAQHTDFDPVVEEFEFTLAVSDYSECVLLPPLMADIATSAPHFKLRIIQYGFYTYQRLLDENDVDLVIASVRQSTTAHRHERLFDDYRQCMYSKNLVKATSPISLDDYLRYRHVVVDRDGHDASPVDTGLVESFGKRRVVGLVTPRFSTLPPVLSRAPVIATLPARIAYVFSNVPDLVVSALPFEAPVIEQSMIWHAAADENPAFLWFLERVRNAAAEEM